MVRWALLAVGVAVTAAPVRDEVSIRDLVQIVDISSLSLSPDGRQVAFRQQASSLDRNSKDLSWWVADLHGPARPRLIGDGGQALWTHAGTLNGEPAQWSADGLGLFYRALIDGEVQVWRASIDGRVPQAVTKDAADVVSISVNADGSGLTYEVGATRADILAAERASRDAGVRIDASVDPAQNLFEAVEINGRLAAQRLTGKWFQRAGLLASTPLTTKSVALDHTSPADSAALPPPRATFEIKAGTLTVRGADQSPMSAPHNWPLGRAIWAAWRPGHDQLVVAMGDPARRQSLYLWDLTQKRVQRLIQSPGLLSGGEPSTPCALAVSEAVCVEQSPEQPPRLVAINLETGANRALAEPNATLRLKPPVAPRVLSWMTADGTHVTGQFFEPPRRTGRRAPLFINYYLCEGYLRGGVGDEYPFALLAQAGIASLCINKVSPPGEGYDAAADYRLATSAISSAIAMLDHEGVIDPRKVGMGGFSFGSEVTMWVAIHTDLLAATAIASTQIEPAYYWLNGAPGRDNHAVLAKSWGLGAPEDTPQRWKLLSPAMNADSLHAPLLMQLPEQEYRLSFELFARLAQTTTPVELYVFPNEPHNKTQPAHKLSTYQRNLDWFRFWLLEESDPDPKKADQYARWREMKARRDASQAIARVQP
ncbi:Atxe2 family lasso peptide isopeptidase [Caulobacter sp. FWC26]|uniref:Atxe2 family lasso peptide isopeptidase n=1 Tax=Caulobacter sp. FWC26 TaxID=69665 RepID=UPI000C1466CD|nr:Atxe2 family lasso peptide isopeptidase [Caulobacter sp. FWC26]AZS19176.1 Atxe2 family lasso peptide isopeptidase [Caulobacter sp. FWC26]